MLFVKSKKGMASNDSVVKMTVALILLVGVSIPVTQQVISEQNLTGLTATIVAFIPVFIAIAGLVLVSKLAK